MEYLSEVISGILCFIFGTGITFHFTKKYYTKNIRQSQKSGKKSINLQAGRDINN